MKQIARVCRVLLLLGLPGSVQAYAFFGQTGAPGGVPQPLQTDGLPVVWPGDEVDVAMTLNFDGLYHDSMVNAMQTSWNDVGTRLQFREGTTAAQPCNANDGVNAAGWKMTTCGGNAFGDALAVTLITHTLRGGRWEISDTDIILDAGRSWIAAGDPSGGQYDFHRVIIHELGHALGLEHPDEVPGQEDVVAIMNSTVSDIVVLQEDDVDGLEYLYGAASGTGGDDDDAEDDGGADPTLALLGLLGWWVRRAGRGQG